MPVVGPSGEKLEGELKYANQRIQTLIKEQTDLLSDTGVYGDMDGVIPPSFITSGDALRSQMASAKGAKAVVAAGPESVDIGEARINQMARAVERVLYGG